MEKQEFIAGLRAALSGRISPAQVEDTVNYYQDYINVEMRKGRSEPEVLSMLGDPRLIARTIVQTSGQQTSVCDEPEPEQSAGAGFGFDPQRVIGRILRLPGWLLGILTFLIVLLILGIVFSVLSFLAPILLVLAAVLFLIKLFRDWLR